MTSGSSFPNRFTKIDDLNRQHHYYLTAEDTCYFLGEYTARAGYAASATNDLIMNMKKPMDRKDHADWRWKGYAISQAATAFRQATPAGQLDEITLVPIPPSKAKNDPLYDDRLTRMLHQIRPAPPLDIRELVVQKQSIDAAHVSNVRPTPEELEKLYEIDLALAKEPKKLMAIVDDVLTTGAHFRAMKAVISRQYPNTRIVGLFIARRVLDTSEFEEIGI